ncbi:unnamed protein product [Allacma fusca]|uniref:Uncharacterized protein n=1 Tax=Allacma fusca TaxID=39272 RepID=A0A8J2KBC7_9HEXA|nr:unnamed protein product [Allacma fusca]
MREIQAAYFRDSHHYTRQRSESCAEIGGTLLNGHKYSHWGFALAETYRQEYVQPDDIQMVNDTIQVVQEAFSDYINEQTTGLIEQSLYSEIIETVTARIGFPEWVFHPSELDEFYRDLILEGQNHLTDHIKFLNWQFDKNMDLFWTGSGDLK